MITRYYTFINESIKGEKTVQEITDSIILLIDKTPSIKGITINKTTYRNIIKNLSNIDDRLFNYFDEYCLDIFIVDSLNNIIDRQHTNAVFTSEEKS